MSFSWETKRMKTPAVEGGKPLRQSRLSFSPPDIGDAEISAVAEVLRSGWITRGERCVEFEKRLCAYTGADHAVALSSATAGLFLTLKAMGVGPDGEVITTPYTFAATANVIVHCGAKPVFADVVRGGFHISPLEVERRITPKTKAIVVVHYGGEPADLDALEDISSSRGIPLVEDAAHAVGSSLGSKKIGCGDHPAAFSFHAVKNLTTGEGGAVTTNDGELAATIRLSSLHGQTRDAREKLGAGGWRYDIALPGYKFNMTDMQAAVGLVQLDKLDENIGKRRRVAARYGEALRGYGFLTLPSEEGSFTHSWHLYPILIDFSALRIDRDELIRALEGENIGVNVHFIPVHSMSWYRKTYGYRPEDFPHAWDTYSREVSLPIYPQMKDREVTDVLHALERLFAYYLR
jgi:dTDP-4-amino-4,6-dideoxygalactose transaminase